MLSATTTGNRLAPAVRRQGPGLAVVAAGVLGAYLVSHVLPWLGALSVAVGLGALLRNSGLLRERLVPGTTFATRRLLRAGVVLLGLRLAVGQVLSLGPAELAVVVTTVVTTFAGTLLLGRWWNVRPGTRLLVATGFAICGAAAVAAMDSVSDTDEEDVATAVALVTLFGGLAIVVLPALRGPLGLDARSFGMWTGASVHEVAQVVAAASTGGAVALACAVVVKLTRVVLLAPLVAGSGLLRGRSTRHPDGGPRPPAVPVFVLGFLTMIAVRSTNLLPAGVLAGARALTTVLLAAALFGLGTAVHVPTLARTGSRAVALGAASTLLATTVAWLGVRLAG
ncbi:MAG TPA: putative sulfate exporter family transporter [Mycobacteriales bacterium]|nr:putative sulfate exporter family transporter [Mycobacteriales bacterium]